MCACMWHTNLSICFEWLTFIQETYVQILFTCEMKPLVWRQTSQNHSLKILLDTAIKNLDINCVRWLAPTHCFQKPDFFIYLGQENFIYIGRKRGVFPCNFFRIDYWNSNILNILAKNGNLLYFQKKVQILSFNYLYCYLTKQNHSSRMYTLNL